MSRAKHAQSIIEENSDSDDNNSESDDDISRKRRKLGLQKIQNRYVYIQVTIMIPDFHLIHFKNYFIFL